MKALRSVATRCLLLGSVAAGLLVIQPGCQRSQEAFDDRTLEQRPHVETVKPEDRRDAFRP